MSKKYQSRLLRTQKKKQLRSAFFYFIFSLAILLTVLFLGIPFLIRMVSLLSELKTPETIIQKEDEVAPQAPIFSSPKTATNSSQINLKGFVEAGAMVILSVDGSEKEVIADNEGDFLFEKITLKEGENRLKAKAVDQAGNESQDSKILLITYDKVPPKLEVEQPEEGAVFSEEKIQIKGKTEEEVVLTINDHQVVLGSAGEFEYPFKLSEGENKVIIIAKDVAGNETKVERTVKLERE